MNFDDEYKQEQSTFTLLDEVNNNPRLTWKPKTWRDLTDKNGSFNVTKQLSKKKYFSVLILNWSSIIFGLKNSS